MYAQKGLATLLFNQMPDTVSIFESVDDGKDFILVDLNPAAEKLDNVCKKSVIGISMKNLFPGADKSGLLDVVRNVWSSGIAETLPAQMARVGGVSRWCESYISKLPDTGHVAIICDNSRSFRDLVDSLFGFIGLCTTDGHLIYVNRAPLAAANLEQDDVIGKLFWETYWWSHSKVVQSKIRNALGRAAKGEVVRDEYEVRIRDNETITVDASFGPMLDDRGKVTRLCGFGVDITGQKQAEEYARET